MAEADADTAAPAQSKVLSTSDVSARLQQVLALLFPSNLAAKAALFAAVVALLPLLPTSQAPRIWELPHLLLLGVIISYGVFGQKNADAAELAAANKPLSMEAYVSEMMQGSFAFGHNDRDSDDDGDGAKDGGGVQAWSSQYIPDDPLVVVAGSGSSVDGKGNTGEKPVHLPVRKLKPADEESAPRKGDISDDGIEEQEFREFVAPKTGYNDLVVRDRAIPSPSSVLDAELSLSPALPSSPPLLPPPPPPPPPFLGASARKLQQKAKARSFNEFGVRDRRSTSAGNKQPQFRSRSAVHARRTHFAGYDEYEPVPVVPAGYEAAADGEEDGEFDEILGVPQEAGAVSDDSSFSSDEDMRITDNDKEEEESYGEEEVEEDDEDSCDEELFELATRPGPEEADDDVAEEVEDEVDRKAEEFIAKFKDQIRMQRIQPARR